jgi:hypothetical protein
VTDGVHPTDELAPASGQPGPLGIGQVLSAAMSLYARNAQTLWKIVGIVIVPVGIINQVVIGASLPSRAFVSNGTLYTPTGTLGTPPGGVVTEIALSVLAALVLEGAISLCLVDAYVGRPRSWTHPLGEAVERLGGLLWLSILYTVIVGVAFIVVIPGIWLAVAWAVSVPALMFEHVGGFRALARSFELTRGRWWATFTALLVALVALFVVLLVVGLLFHAIESGLKVSSVGLWLGLNWLGSMLTDLIALPFVAAVVAVIYIDLRVRKEGIDLERLAGAFERSVRF